MATDDFNRGDEQLDVSANWTSLAVNANRLRIVTNEVTGASAASAIQAEFFVGAAVTDTQTAEIVVTDIGTADPGRCGPILQAQTDRNFYAFDANAGSEQFFKFNTGTYSLISFITMTALANNDVMRFEIDADGNMEAFVNDSSVGTDTDVDHTGGQPGFYGFEDDAGIDNFDGGDVGGSPVMTVAAMTPEQNVLLRM